MLMQEIEEILEDNGFRFCEYRGCFDIAARRESMLLLKVLSNVDSFQEEQAKNLKILSRELGARSLLVGLHTRREALSDNTVYDRFDIPTVNPKALENILRGDLPYLYRFRGGLFAEIDLSILRKAREDADLSQSDLAKKIGVTKKSIYEHETKKMKIRYKNALKIERLLKAKIIMPLELKTEYNVEASPKSKFENNVSRKFIQMGFDTDSVYQTPFNMIVKETNLMLLSDVEENKKQIEKNIPYMSRFSKLAKKSAMVITKEEINLDMPTIREDELKDMSPKDIRRRIKNW